MKSYGYKLFCSMLIATFFLSIMPIVPAHAGLVGTGEVLSHATVEQDRARVFEILERDDVVAQLERHGVSLAEAQARVAALSDAEVRMMAERLETLPAGGNVLGILFSVFIILLVTDLLGLTNVFPFTRKN